MESSQFFSTQALEYLNDIHERIHEVRLQNESTCRDITQLLNKPWPGKTSSAASCPTGTQEGSRGPTSASEQTNDDNVFSAEEQSMLAEVDSVLAQAQKLRQFQSKVKTKQTDNNNQDKDSLKVASAPDSADAHKSTKTAEPSVAPDQQLDQHSQNAPTNQNANNSGGDTSDIAIISARDLDRLLKKDPPLKKEMTSKMSHPMSGTTKTSKQLISKRPPSGSSSSSRVASRKDTQFKTSSSEIGRHTSRPPSRIGDTQSRYMQSAKAKASAKGHSKKDISHVTGNPTNIRQTSSKGQTKRPSSAKGTSNELQRVPSGKQDVKTDNRHTGTQRNSDSVEVDHVTQSVAQLEVSKAKGTRPGNVHQETKSLSSTQVDSAPKIEKTPFMLRRDGSSLTIPTKLKKHYQTNAKLRDKLTWMIHEDVSHADCFLDLFGDNKYQPLSEVPLDAQLERLIAEYRHLIQLTRDVRKQFQAIHGKTHWEDVYYLQTMSEVIKQRQQEISKQFKELEGDLSDRKVGTVQRSSHKATKSSPFLWHQVDKLKDEWLSVPDGNILQYSSRADLLKWNELVYQIQLLQQEMIIQEVAGNAILDLLSGTDCEDPSYATLYRIANGVILNSGSVYPVMISDEERSITPTPGY